MLRVQSLTKRYRTKVAVDHITFTASPGQVTGFLGPNGAGKSTTMRMLVGLDRPTSGTAEFNGLPYRDLVAPLHEVGVLLDARSAHKQRTAYKHLLAIAATHAIPPARVHEVIGLAGLEAVAGKRVGGFSLGMSQRLGIAAALLGDPKIVILDEPTNGLDPDGILWIRALLRQLASEGRTVLLSSHLMSEMSHTADHLIVIGRGTILADGPLHEVVAGATSSAVRVRTPQMRELTRALATAHPNVAYGHEPDGTVTISGVSAAQIAACAATAAIVLLELTPVAGSLEDAYLALTTQDTEYLATAAQPDTTVLNRSHAQIRSVTQASQGTPTPKGTQR